MTDYIEHNNLYYIADQITHAQSLIDQAITRAGTHQPGRRVKVQFSGCFYCHEGDEPPVRYNRHRQFTVTFEKAERFLSQPTLEMVFDQYGIAGEGVYVLWVDAITVEYVD